MTRRAHSAVADAARERRRARYRAARALPAPPPVADLPTTLAAYHAYLTTYTVRVPSSDPNTRARVIRRDALPASDPRYLPAAAIPAPPSMLTAC